MKKIYSLLFLMFVSVSFGQILTEDFNYADNALLTDNGWTVHSGGTTEAIDVGASNGLLYAGYNTTAGNAARLDNNGQDINKAFTAPATSGSVYFSFLINVTAAVEGYFVHLGPGGTATSPYAARIFVKPSVNAGKINFGLSNSGTASYAATPTDFDLNTTYLVIVKYDVSASGPASMWIKASGVPATEAAAGTPEHTTTGSGTASVAAFYLRQYNAGQNITIDEVKVYTTWFGATPCSLSLGTEIAACDASTLNLDTYNVSIPFTGGNSGTYNLSVNAGTIGGDSPSSNATGFINIINIPEGTNVTLTVSGTCNFTKTVTSPECKPVNDLPYSESFPYTVGNALGAQQKWTNVNSGDDIVATAGNLTYTGVTSSGNSISFTGGGKECATPFTATTSGTIYAAFLFSVNDLTTVTATTPETYFAGITGTSNSDYKGRVFLKKSGTQYQIGFDTTATTTNYDATLRNVGDVVYIVIGYDFAANLLALWINPTAGAAPSLSVTPATAFTSIGGFTLRQDADNLTPNITFDELRVVLTAAELGLTLGTKENAIAGFKVYPNPVANGTLFVETAANAEKAITVYDILGKQVLNTTTTDNAINVSTLRAGVYVVKVTEEGKTAAQKLVIK